LTIRLECKVCGFSPPAKTMRIFNEAVERHFREEHPFELSVLITSGNILTKKSHHVPKCNAKIGKAGVP